MPPRSLARCPQEFGRIHTQGWFAPMVLDTSVKDVTCNLFTIYAMVRAGPACLSSG